MQMNNYTYLLIYAPTYTIIYIYKNLDIEILPYICTTYRPIYIKHNYNNMKLYFFYEM